jgi:hypothetical protein
MPNEVFALTGLKLKAQSPLQPTFNISLANGAEGYIPPPEQHRLGGYTTWPARTAGLEVEAEPRIVEAVLRLLEEVAARPRRSVETLHGPYVEKVLHARPAGYWRLEEMTFPRARDLVGRGGDGTFEAGVALFLPGVGSGEGRLPRPELTASPFSGTAVNRAAHFCGGRLRVPTYASGSGYGVELWIWNGLPSDARAVTGYFYSRGRNGNLAAVGEHLGIGGTNHAAQTGRLILVNGHERDRVLVGHSVLGLRKWHHVFLERRESRVTVYLDGQADLTGELEDPFPPTEPVEMFFGGRCDNVANFEGKLDEIAIYRGALGAEEVAAHYAAAGLNVR